MPDTSPSRTYVGRMQDELLIQVRTHDGCVMVVVDGDLDLHARGELSTVSRPLAQEAECFVADLTGVGFIDSTGLGELVGLRKVLRERDIPMNVVPSPRVQAVLKLAGLLAVFSLHATVDDALARSGPRRPAAG